MTRHLETKRTEQASRSQSSVAADVGTVAEVDYAATEAAAATDCTVAVVAAAAEGTAAPECSQDMRSHAWRDLQQRRKTSADNSGRTAKIRLHWSFSRGRTQQC